MNARSWTQPLPSPMAEPDAFLHLRLRVTDAWLGESGEWLAIAEASNVVLWSILGYLRWHGPAIQASDPAGPTNGPTNGPANGAANGAVDAYLASRPLVAAIDQELARRGETDPGDALAVLQAIGRAPWEVPAPSRIRARTARR